MTSPLLAPHVLAADQRVAVIYHAPCADGFSAAWVVHHAVTRGRASFTAAQVSWHPTTYNRPVPDDVPAGAHVLLVDFCYPSDVLARLCRRHASVTVLDHHATARGWVTTFAQEYENDSCIDRFDLRMSSDRSGAGITWDFFFPGVPRPLLLDMVEDRDLWRFRLDGTREASAALFSYSYSFDEWDRLMSSDATDILRLRALGQGLQRKLEKDLHEIMANGVRWFWIRGHHCPVLNVPHMMASAAGQRLAQLCFDYDGPQHQYTASAFGATYYDTDEARHFSLRSVAAHGERAANVRAIAETYGGGGHVNAAGFSVPRNHSLATC